MLLKVSGSKGGNQACDRTEPSQVIAHPGDPVLVDEVISGNAYPCYRLCCTLMDKRNKMMRSGLVCVFILLGLSGSLAGRAQGAMTNDQAVKAYLSGDPNMKDGPDFGMVDTALAPVSLSSLKGKYVVLDFWASWCGPCMYEYPYMEKLEAKFKGKNIEFVSVSCDDQIPCWKSAIIKHHMDGRLQWHVSDLAILRALKVARIPRFVLLDKEGRVIDSDLTRPSDPEMAGYLRSLKGI